MKNPESPPVPLHYRDATGHVEQRYAADLRARSRERAEPRDPVAFSDEDFRRDSFSEMLAEEFVRAATSGEEDATGLLDEVSPDELGGPFVELTSADELADTDPATPEDATREPLPRPHQVP
jgi:hypothetical protein